MIEYERLRQTQHHELELLEKFKEICEKEGLRYYLVGGTAIGAMRHGGFIPWDDDVDVALLRDDYDKFIKVASRYLEPGQEILHYSLKDDYKDCSMKLVNQKIFYRMKTENSVITQNVWIDIFPIDGTFANNNRQKLHYLRVYFLRMLLAYYYFDRIQYNDERVTWKKALITIAKYIPVNKLINPSKIRVKIDKVLRRVPIDTQGSVGNYLGAYGVREFVPYSIFGEGRPRKFEDKEFLVPTDCEKYLTAIYGDYMKLPPKEKQVPRHNVIEVKIADSLNEK